MLVGAAIGALAPSLRDVPWSDDPQVLAQAIVGNPNALIWANALFLAATLITTFALVVISNRFDRAARSWALVAFTTFFFAAVFEVFDRLMSMSVYPWAALQGVDVTSFTAQAFIRLDNVLGVTFHTLGFLAIALFGIAFTRAGLHRWFGWLILAGGLFGIILQVVGVVIPAFVFLGTTAFGVGIWFFGVGIDVEEVASG